MLSKISNRLLPLSIITLFAMPAPLHLLHGAGPIAKTEPTVTPTDLTETDLPLIIGSMLPFPASLTVTSSGEYTPHPSLNLAEFKKYVEWGNGIVIDARTLDDFIEGHVPGALSFPSDAYRDPYKSLKSQLEPFKDQLIVVYCSNGPCNSKLIAQNQLRFHGYRFVAVFDGGIKEWLEAGESIESDFE